MVVTRPEDKKKEKHAKRNDRTEEDVATEAAVFMDADSSSMSRK